MYLPFLFQFNPYALSTPTLAVFALPVCPIPCVMATCLCGSFLPGKAKWSVVMGRLLEFRMDNEEIWRQRFIGLNCAHSVLVTCVGYCFVSLPIPSGFNHFILPYCSSVMVSALELRLERVFKTIADLQAKLVIMRITARAFKKGRGIAKAFGKPAQARG